MKKYGPTSSTFSPEILMDWTSGLKLVKLVNK